MKYTVKAMDGDRDVAVAVVEGEDVAQQTAETYVAQGWVVEVEPKRGRGRPRKADTDRKVPIDSRVTPWVLGQLTDLARKRGVTLSVIVRQACEAYIIQQMAQPQEDPWLVNHRSLHPHLTEEQVQEDYRAFLSFQGTKQ